MPACLGVRALGDVPWGRAWERALGSVFLGLFMVDVLWVRVSRKRVFWGRVLWRFQLSPA